MMHVIDFTASKSEGEAAPLYINHLIQPFNNYVFLIRLTNIFFFTVAII